MKRKFGVGILILCFGLSSIDAVLADQVVQIQPIVVQPDDLRDIDEQALEQDRINRDQELAIKGLMDDNQELTKATLANQHDPTLDKIRQTMINYRDSLLSRDRARIIANSKKLSKYYDLIRLTEDVDDVKDVGQTLELKRDVIQEKYKILNDLKSEMMTLNAKLQDESSRQVGAANQQNTIIENFKETEQQEENKIQILTQRLGEMDQRIATYDEILAQKDQQIAQLKDNLARVQRELLQRQTPVRSSSANNLELSPIIVNASKDQPSSSINNLELPPIIVNGSNTTQQPMAPEANKGQVDQLGIQLSQKQDQVDLLKSELENKITETKSQDQTIKQQQNQIAILNAQSQDLTSKEGLMKAQADQLAQASEQFKNQSAIYTAVKDNVMVLRNNMQRQAIDLKAKNETIRWLNQVLAVAKNKAEYYKLTSQQDQLSMKQVQQEVQNIKDDFGRQFKDYGQFENSIVSLKDQVNQLGLQLTQKQNQVDALKAEVQGEIKEKDQMKQADLDLSQKRQQQVDFLRSEILNIISHDNKHGQEETQLQQDFKDQLQGKENQIVKIKADLLAILQAQANKEIYRRNATARVDDRVNLARQLIDLQEQEAALLEEKSDLWAAHDAIFEQHVLDLQNKIQRLLVNHRIQTGNWESRAQELKDLLSQKEGQVEALNAELRNKISQEKNQGILAEQIQDLKAQLQDNEDQIATLKSNIQSGQTAMEEAGSLKQQLTAEQDKGDLLKQQLDSKIVESNKMTGMMGEYQKKLEDKDNAYNEQLGQVLAAKNYQVQLEKQITDLNAQLQQKEAQVVTIKKDMYDLQELANAKDRDIQTKDLSLSMIQQKMMDDKIDEYQAKINGLHATNASQSQEITSLKTDLALARQELQGMPSSDEIDFLRTGLKAATQQLKQKDEMLSQIKANAAEYAKEFKEQTQEFQSLKDQLVDAKQELGRRDEDLKYKDLEVVRLKERSVVSEGDLQDQIKVLTQKLEIADKELQGKTHENKVEALQAQLKNAHAQITALQTQVDQLKPSSNNSPLDNKLKQALDKIDQQGRAINILAKKLLECGQSVDLSQGHH